jgi:single-strand DNA-binding protein
MPDLNSVTLSGRLGSDPELRHTGSGTPVASARIATEGRKPKDGGDPEVSWVSLTIWGKGGEAFVEWNHKGDGVIVKGRLRENRWEAQDGSKRSQIEVVVDDWYFPPGRKSQGGGGARSSAPSNGAPADDLAPVGAPAGGGGGWDEDIPF